MMPCWTRRALPLVGLICGTFTSKGHASAGPIAPAFTAASDPTFSAFDWMDTSYSMSYSVNHQGMELASYSYWTWDLFSDSYSYSYSYLHAPFNQLICNSTTPTISSDCIDDHCQHCAVNRQTSCYHDGGDSFGLSCPTADGPMHMDYYLGPGCSGEIQAHFLFDDNTCSRDPQFSPRTKQPTSAPTTVAPSPSPTTVAPSPRPTEALTSAPSPLPTPSPTEFMIANAGMVLSGYSGPEDFGEDDAMVFKLALVNSSSVLCCLDQIVKCFAQNVQVRDSVGEK